MKAGMTIQEVDTLRLQAQQDIRSVIDKLRDEIGLPLTVEIKEYDTLGGGSSFFSVIIEVKI